MFGYDVGIKRISYSVQNFARSVARVSSKAGDKTVVVNVDPQIIAAVGETPARFG